MEQQLSAPAFFPVTKKMICSNACFHKIVIGDKRAIVKQIDRYDNGRDFFNRMIDLTVISKWFQT